MRNLPPVEILPLIILPRYRVSDPICKTFNIIHHSVPQNNSYSNNLPRNSSDFAAHPPAHSGKTVMFLCPGLTSHSGIAENSTSAKLVGQIHTWQYSFHSIFALKHIRRHVGIRDLDISAAKRIRGRLHACRFPF